MIDTVEMYSVEKDEVPDATQPFYYAHKWQREKQKRMQQAQVLHTL
jgi:hypothetical protein